MKNGEIFETNNRLLYWIYFECVFIFVYIFSSSSCVWLSSSSSSIFIYGMAYRDDTPLHVEYEWMEKSTYQKKRNEWNFLFYVFAKRHLPIFIYIFFTLFSIVDVYLVVYSLNHHQSIITLVEEEEKFVHHHHHQHSNTSREMKGPDKKKIFFSCCD